MEAVKSGGDRQDLHERIRVHCRAAADRLKEGAAENDLLERLRADDAFAPVAPLLVVDPDPSLFVGRAPQQVEEYLEGVVAPLLADREELLGGSPEVFV